MSPARCSTSCRCPGSSCGARRRPTPNNLNPANQDVKTDFQKQNVRRFRLADTQAARGWAAVDDWRGPFLSLTYRGGPDSALSERAGGTLGDTIGCVVSIAGRALATLRAPYDAETDRYVVEIWGRDQGQLRGALGARGQAAVDAGSLIGRPDLVSAASATSSAWPSTARTYAGSRRSTRCTRSFRCTST